EDLQTFGRRAVARFNPERYPDLARGCNVENSIRRHSAVRRNRHTCTEPKRFPINGANRSIPAVADVNHAIANGRRGWSDYYFATAPLDFASLQSSHLRHSIRRLIDYIHTPSIARGHPQFSCRAIVREVVQGYCASRTGQTDWL